MRPLSVLDHVLAQLPWITLDYDPKTKEIPGGYRVIYRMTVNGQITERAAEDPNACRALSRARYKAADAALRTLPEHRKAELRALGHEAAWRRPLWLEG